MNDLRTAAQQALEAMRRAVPTGEITLVDWMKANHDLEAALAEPDIDPLDEYRKGFIDGQIDMRDRPEELAEPVQEPVVGNWSVFNTGAEVFSGMSLPDAVAELTPARLERGWSAVCVINKDNPPTYAPPQRPAEPVQEPVAWRTFDGEGGYDYRTYEDNEDYAAEWAKRNPRHVGWVEPLYTAPPASVSEAPHRKPLTEEEILLISVACAASHQQDDVHFARAVEAAHGIKDRA